MKCGKKLGRKFFLEELPEDTSYCEGVASFADYQYFYKTKIDEKD